MGMKGQEGGSKRRQGGKHLDLTTLCRLSAPLPWELQRPLCVCIRQDPLGNRGFSRYSDQRDAAE